MNTRPDNSCSDVEIMVVDDTPESLKLLTDLLRSEGYGVRPANDPRMALESALAEPPNLILLDVRMPGMDGFEVCQHLKQDPRTKDVPILFVSASDDTEDHVKGFRVGGVDYITKPINKDEVLARVHTHMELSRIKKNLEQLVDERTEQLRESEKRLEMSLDFAYVAVWEWDIETNEISWIGTISSDTGFTLDALGTNYDSFMRSVHPDDREHLKDSVDKCIEQNIPYDVEHRVVWPDGTILWLLARGNVYRDEAGTALKMMGTVQDISTRKQLKIERDVSLSQLFDSRERLRALSDHLQKVREEEKTHLSRELHDELGGTLTAIRLDVAWLKQMDIDNHVELDGKVNGILDMVDSVISVTRRIVSELRPVLLDEIGLWAAIEWQLKEFGKRTKIDSEIIPECDNCVIKGGCDKTLFTPEISITLYRIFQEALTNISRYASATQVEVGCCVCDNSVVLTIKDNGVGFDSSILSSLNSHGIRGMYERVGSLGGTLNVESKLNTGTFIEAKLPLSKE